MEHIYNAQSHSTKQNCTIFIKIIYQVSKIFYHLCCNCIFSLSQWQGSGGLTCCWQTDPAQAYQNQLVAKQIAKHPSVKKFYKSYGNFGDLNEKTTIQRIGARMSEHRKKLKRQFKVIIMHLCKRTDQIQSTDQTSGGICSVNETGFSSLSMQTFFWPQLA